MGRRYLNMAEFYGENTVRFKSAEADYGVMWTDEGRTWPHWRVSYLHDTGELYAVRLAPRVAGDSGPVELLGVVPVDPTGVTGRWYRTCDAILEGWAEGPMTLDWIRERLASPADVLAHYVSRRAAEIAEAEQVGVCPLCGEPVIENEDGDRYCSADAGHYSSHTTMRSFLQSFKPLGGDDA